MGKIPSRTQSSAAIGAEGRWFLVNASPDVARQIESFPALHPASASARNSPVRDVLLTNADLDHVLGLFQLRERGENLRVHCTGAVRETLVRDLNLGAILGAFCGVEWRELPEMSTPLFPGGPACRAIPLPAGPPRYATPSPGAQSVALEFTDAKSGARLVVAPDVGAMTPELESALEAAHAVLFDGTFWSDNELLSMDPRARTSSEMGHLPISGGSLERLRGLGARHRVYLHINNTNPVLAPGSPERAAVEEAGILVGEDGMEFDL